MTPMAVHTDIPSQTPFPGKLLYSLSKQDLKREEEKKTWKSGNNEFHRVVKLTSQTLQGKSPNNIPEGGLKGRLAQMGDGLDVPGDHACLQEHEIRFVVAVETQGLTIAQAGVNSCSCLSLT